MLKWTIIATLQAFAVIFTYRSTRRAKMEQTQTAIVLSVSPVVWISQYLTNGKARVHVDGTYSHKKTLRGDPQEGVLSPTLLFVFINDIVKTCLVKSWEPCTPTIWSCGAQKNTLQLQTIDCSRRWTSWKVGQNSGSSKSTPGRPPILSSAFQERNRRPTCVWMVRPCLLRTTAPTWGSLSTSGWHGNKLRKQKQDPRCDLPSWRSGQAQYGVQILWLSGDYTLVESDQCLSMAWQHGALKPSPTLIRSAKNTTRQPAPSKGPRCLRR